MEKFGTFELNRSHQPEILHVLADVITEWSAIWKQYYVSHNSNFYSLEKHINDLINLRKEISNRKLLVDQLREKQKLALLAINVGNKFLKLDIMISDEQGNIINPLQTPILRLYEYYTTTSKHIHNKNATWEYKMSITNVHYQRYNYNVYLHVKNQDETSALSSIDYVKNMVFSEVITRNDVKSDFYTNLVNGNFSKGFNLLFQLVLSYPMLDPANVLKHLMTSNELNADEMLMFLHEVLETLFVIFKNNSRTNTLDTMVFDCLIYIIELVSDDNHWEFKSVLDLYIKEYFNTEVAYSKLMVVLKNYLKNWDQIDVNYLSNIYKSLNYIMKFIVRSKSLSSELKKDKDQDQQMFEKSMNEILTSIMNIMLSNSDSAKFLHSICLKYVPQSIFHVTTVFSSKQLSSFLVELLNCLHPTQLVKLKLITMSDIVQSQLFLNADCRAILLPCIIVKVKELLYYPDFLSWCKKAIAKLCGDILDLLYITDEDSKFNDITEIMTTSLHTTIHLVKVIDHEERYLVGYVASLMISILNQMTDKHFDTYIKHFADKTDLLNFLNKILSVFTDILSRSLIPGYWYDMKMLYNSVILKSLKHFAHAIREYFFDDFEKSVWTNFFHCAFTFLLQPSLQLENFSCNKRSRFLGLYKDIRIASGILIQTMWSYLRLHKIHFMPDMVSFFLETSLIPESELRKTTIPIFFDMMQCEFYSWAGNGENNRGSSNRNAKFDIFQSKMIENIDRLVTDGKGDEQFKELFETIMLMHCENHSTMRDQGVEFVEKFTNLLERLLEYQTWINDENIDNKINCTVNVLNFYKDIQKHEMIISYVNKLCSLHLECGNFTEAAYTLKMYSELLSWSNDPLPSLLKSPMRYPTCETQCQLKEALLKDTIDYFNKGKTWESAVIECEELAVYYKSHTYDYSKLSSLLHIMSKFYDNMLKELRTESKYYRIAYYGRGFPLFLQNKVFIYRGKQYEGSSDLSKSTMNQFPNATFVQNVSKLGPEITDSFNQYIQISIVKPVMDDRYKSLEGSSVSEKVIQHYRVNYVKKFHFSQKSKHINAKENSNNDNKFAKLWIERTEIKTLYSLPNIVRWCPIIDSHTYQVSPLEIAIETMEDKNRSLKQLLLGYQIDQEQPLNPLSMTLHGILDPAVMGGISNYEQAFFSSEYLKNHKEDMQLIDKLKYLITSQIPLLDLGLKLHKIRVPLSMYKTHSHLEKCLKNMKKHIEKNYTKKTPDTPSENCFEITFREQRYYGSNIKSADELNFVTRPAFVSSNSVYGYPRSTDFSNSNVGSNKYHTVGRTFLRNETAEKKLTRTYSRSLERINSLSNISE